LNKKTGKSFALQKIQQSFEVVNKTLKTKLTNVPHFWKAVKPGLKESHLQPKSMSVNFHSWQNL
jgi:hypothetical protein